MAIALDSSGLWDEDNASLTGTSAVVGSGLSNSILVVHIEEWDFEGDEVVTSVDSDQGGAFTQVGSNVNIDNANASIWYLLNPSVATHSIDLTTPTGGSRPISGIWSLWTGVDQTTPFGTSNTATGTSDSPSVTVTTASGEVVIDSLCTEPTSTVTNGADQTTVETNFVSVSNTIRGHVSQQAGADGGVMSYTLSISRDWAIISAPLKPAAQDFTLTADSGSVTVSGLAASLFTGTAPLQAIRDFVLKIG